MLSNFLIFYWLLWLALIFNYVDIVVDFNRHAHTELFIFTDIVSCLDSTGLPTKDFFISYFYYTQLTPLCCAAVQPDRSCQVAVTSEKIFLSPFTANNGNATATCGSGERPWLLEARSGQRINISLLDFTGSSSSTSSAHRTRTVETASSSGCQRQFGFIEDKSANRNIDICSDAAHRQPTLYVSRSNQVDIVLTSRQQTAPNFLISVKGLSNIKIIIVKNTAVYNAVKGDASETAKIIKMQY